MHTNPGSDLDPDDERIAQEIEKLQHAVLTFRHFLSQLSPCRRSTFSDSLPWSDEGSDLWIDFTAWVQTTLAELRDPHRQHQLK